jgi:hypothetical protein
MTDRPRQATPDELTKLATIGSEATAFEREIATIASRSAATVGARYGARAAVEALAQHRGPGAAPASPGAAPGPSWAGVRHRAAEHVVTQGGAATAATPNGSFNLGPEWVVDLGAEWTEAAQPIIASTSIVEVPHGQGVPAIPAITTAPTAGPQPGEKLEVFSKAFTIGAATNTVEVNATLQLNWSGQLEATGAAELGWAVASATVAAEADRQVGAAIVTRGTAVATLDAALALFATGRYLPSVLLVGPGGLGALGSYRVADLEALGVRVVLAKVTKPILLAPSAVLGWLLPMEATKPEPSVLGTSKAWAWWGRVAVDPTGVAVIG